MTKALIIIDMQNGVVNPAGKVIYNQTGLVHLINERIDSYRSSLSSMWMKIWYRIRRLGSWFPA